MFQQIIKMPILCGEKKVLLDTAVLFLESGLHYFCYKLHKVLKFRAISGFFYLPEHILFWKYYFNESESLISAMTST